MSIPVQVERQANRGTDRLTLGCRGPFSKFKIAEVLRKLFKTVVEMAVCQAGP